jgi:hypothetical protein
MNDMDWLVQEAVDMIVQGTGIAESIDAIVLTNDLTAGETRSIIYFLAQKGYKYVLTD